MSILDRIQERLDFLTVHFGPRWKVVPKRVLLSTDDFREFLDCLVADWKEKHRMTDVEFGAVKVECSTAIAPGRPEVEFGVELR